MALLAVLFIISIFVILVLIYMIIRKNVQISRITTDHVDLKSVHRSTLVKHGKSFEQLFPYMSSYPYDMNNFRFIGSPIDGLSFEDNSVVFVEFKTGKSKLTKKQERVKKLIKDKKVEWKEIRA